MDRPKSFSFKDRIKSFSYALQGIKTFFQTQHNAWIHTLAGICVIVLGIVFKLTIPEWCWIIFAFGLVFMAEMLNTAIEFLTDLVSPEYHPLAKKVKDVAAGAVLFAAIIAFIIGLIILIPKML